MDDTMRAQLESWLTSPLALQLVVLGIGLLVIAIAVAVLRRVTLRYIRDNATRYRARKAMSFLAYLAATVFALLVFSERLGGLTLAFGVAGAGVAFALQEVIASVAGWIGVSFGQMYKVGDRVRIGDIQGDVIDISTLRTTVMEIGGWVEGDQYSGRIVRVPNSFAVKEPVYNYSGEFPFLWDEIRVPIKYGSDYHEARALIERVAEEVSGDYARAAEAAWTPVTRRYVVEAATVRPLVMMSADEHWIEFALRYVVDYKLRRTTRDRLFTRILEEIDSTDGRVGIAASTLNIEKVPPLDVHVTGAGTP